MSIILYLLRDRIRTSNNDENVVQDVQSDDIRDKFKQDTLRDESIITQ